MTPLIGAVLEFEERLIGLDALLEAFDQVAGDSPPPWLLVMAVQVKALNSAFEPISTLSRAVQGHDKGVLQ